MDFSNQDGRQSIVEDAFYGPARCLESQFVDSCTLQVNPVDSTVGAMIFGMSSDKMFVVLGIFGDSRFCRALCRGNRTLL